MKLTGDYTFEASRDEVWKALLDPEVLSRTLPGCEDLRQSAENTFEGKLAMKVGPVQGVFQGKVELSDLTPPTGYTLTLTGKGAPGFVNGKGRLELEESGATTLLRYEVDAQVGGRIAGVGQRLLDSSAKVITRQALEGLDAQIRRRGEAGRAVADEVSGQRRGRRRRRADPQGASGGRRGRCDRCGARHPRTHSPGLHMRHRLAT